MATGFRLSVYNVVANPGPETLCCEARQYKTVRTFYLAPFAAIAV